MLDPQESIIRAPATFKCRERRRQRSTIALLENPLFLGHEVIWKDRITEPVLLTLIIQATVWKDVERLSYKQHLSIKKAYGQ